MPSIEYKIICDHCEEECVEGHSNYFPKIMDYIVECKVCNDDVCDSCGDVEKSIHKDCLHEKNTETKDEEE